MKNPFEIYVDYFLLVKIAKDYFNNGKSVFDDDFEYQIMELSKHSQFEFRRDRTAVALGTKELVSTLDLGLFGDVVTINEVIKYLKAEISLRNGRSQYLFVKDILMTELRRIIEPFCDKEFVDKLNYYNKTPRKSNAEQYLLNCFTLTDKFRKPFEKMCSDYDVNLAKIQNELNCIYIDIVPKEKFKYNIEFISEIYDISNGNIFRCEKIEDFCEMVETADFSKLDISVEYKAKKLISYLSKHMPKNWYILTANSKGWKPTDCSRVTVESHDVWMTKLRKIKP